MIKLFTVVLVAAAGVFAQNLPAKPVSLASALPNPVAIVKAAVGIPAPVNVKSYKEWKNEKVQIAIKKVTITRAQIDYRKLNKQFIQTNEPVSAKDVELDKLEASLKNDLYSLEVARELSVTDYFAIYLTKQDNKTEAYKEAADKMTPDEVNQLIRAYADSMFSTNGHGSPSGKVGPTAMEKSDKSQ
jgi:hypothetical protein